MGRLNMIASRLAGVVRPPSPLKRPRRLARPRTPPFHGDNMGSNPIGDANPQVNSKNLDDQGKSD
jgi:hypothetical protein